jgi:hypothetical protein
MIEESPKTGQEGWRDEPPSSHLLILAGRHVILLIVMMFPEEECAVRLTCNKVLEVLSASGPQASYIAKQSCLGSYTELYNQCYRE